MEQRARASLSFLMALAAVLPFFTGCGMVAPPQAPTLYLPQSPTDLSAARIGNDVHLHWTMPKRTTDRVLLKGEQKAHICRSIAGSPCEAAGDAQYAPLAQADFVDHLPAALVSGQPQLITYTVLLQNKRGRTAGPSNAAYSVSGPAPSPAASFNADAHTEGVILHWQPVSDSSTLIRMQRTQNAVKKDSIAERKGADEPLQQTLEVGYSADHDPGHAYDKSAAFDQTYRYVAQRITVFNLEGHKVEIASDPTPVFTLNTKDVFPPAVPTGLVVVASPDEHAIDLSWSANTENDLAGYIVYRREAGSSAAPTRISPSEPVAGPAFRDTTAKPGVRYAYSVSAIDNDKNESARSTEAEESLPQ